jgi:hypothetical protein
VPAVANSACPTWRLACSSTTVVVLYICFVGRADWAEIEPDCKRVQVHRIQLPYVQVR